MCRTVALQSLWCVYDPPEERLIIGVGDSTGGMAVLTSLLASDWDLRYGDTV